MRKRHLFTLLFLSTLVGMTSCDDSFLDQTVTTDLDETTVFADSTYTSGFLSQIYSDVGFDVDIDRFGNIIGSGKGGLQIACDEAEPRKESATSTGSAFATGTVNALTVASDVWSTCYTNIRRCNVFMKNVSRSPMNEITKKQYAAEARFLRAWYYYILLRHYGGIPLIGDAIYKADDKVKSTRDTYADCVDYIVSECQALLDEGALQPRNSGRSNGRINAACCYALIMRVKLDAASPLHNGSGFGTEQTKLLLGYADNNPQRWVEAYNAARAAMVMKGDYRLYENHFCDDFPVAGPEKGWGFYAVQFPGEYLDCTSYGDYKYPFGPYQEVILMRKLPLGISTAQKLDPPSFGGNGSAGYVYADLADAFPMIDGKPITESSITYNPLKPADGRDPRFNNTVVYNGSKLYNQGSTQVTCYTFTGDNSTQDAVFKGTPTGLYTRKMLSRGASGNWWIEPIQSHPLIRFAEVMLTYAECCNEAYGPDFTEDLGNGVKGGALEMLKLIRRRAGINAGADGMYGLKANMTQEEMREAIRLERRLELAFEGFRFFDVRRWMIADKTDNKTMHGTEIARVLDENNNVVYKARTFDVSTHVFRKAMYYWPIPYTETVKTPDLLQNPYYD